MFSTVANAGQEKSLLFAAKRCNETPKIFRMAQIAQYSDCTGLPEHLEAVRTCRDANKLAARRVRGLDVARRIADKDRRARLRAVKLSEAPARRRRQRLTQLAVFGIRAANELVERDSRRFELDPSRRHRRAGKEADCTILDRKSTRLNSSH